MQFIKKIIIYFQKPPLPQVLLFKIRRGGLSPLNNSKAQVIIEYILLLALSAAIALLFINVVSVTSPSPVFEYWKNLLEVIADDISS